MIQQQRSAAAPEPARWLFAHLIAVAAPAAFFARQQPSLKEDKLKPLSGPASSPQVLRPASMALPQVYGREQEKARLQRMGGTEPTHIALFTGPPNSGKTALLKDYCEGRQYQGVCYMDCWQEDTTTPTGFACSLAKQGLPTLVHGLPPQYASKSSLPSYFTLKDVLETIEATLKNWQQAHINGALSANAPYPIIIIDKAESLLELSKYFGSEFKTLLRFLVRVSKQEKLAHVWLATSSWGLTGLLEKELDRSYWQPVAIPHLQEDEAKGLLRHLLGWPSLEDDSSPTFLLPPPRDSMSSSALESAQQGGLPSEEEQAAIIDQVYKVVGGNPGQLRTVGLALRSGETVEEALKPHVAMALAAVQSMMLGGSGYTGKQFATLAALIVQGGGACRREDAELQLGRLFAFIENRTEQRKKGREVLEAMLSANVVRLQPPSSIFAARTPAARPQLTSGDVYASLQSSQSLSPQPSFYPYTGVAAAGGQGSSGQSFMVTAPSAFDLQLWAQQWKRSEPQRRASALAPVWMFARNVSIVVMYVSFFCSSGPLWVVAMIVAALCHVMSQQ